MRHNAVKRITVGADDTHTLRIPLKPGCHVLRCVSSNSEIVECTHTRTTVLITGIRPGTAAICVWVGAQGRPAAQLVYSVQVVEEDEE